MSIIKKIKSFFKARTINTLTSDNELLKSIFGKALAAILQEAEGIFIEFKGKKYMIVRQKDVLAVSDASNMEGFEDVRMLWYNKNREPPAQ